jgi:protocatechuate 3,4-dioxygenase alpha subunit
MSATPAKSANSAINVVTGSQTIGPFWHMLADPTHADLTRFGAAGNAIALTGRVVDGDGAAVSDGCIEIWQATPAASPVFPGWGRCATDGDGQFRFVTLAPDAAAPYVAVLVFARGLVKPLWTRVYFADAADPVLTALPAARRATLLARPEPAGSEGPARWRWDVRLQGDGETVFLDF